MGLITLRLCEFRFMLNAVLEGYALLTVFTQTKSSLRSSSSISLCRKHEKLFRVFISCQIDLEHLH
ncbi:unnamed protein product [Brassica oleracea]